MNTQTHLLVAAALLAKPDAPKRNIALIIGALLPDIAIFILFGWAMATGVSQGELWGRIYFSQPMLTFTAIGNSAPLYGAIALSAWAYVRWRAGEPLPVLPILTVLSLAALSHLALDFPVHVDDAHPHFWPITEWRFRSPVSYWNSNFHARWVTVVELLVALGLLAILWRRFTARWVRAILSLAGTAYIAVPAFWYLQFS